MDVAPETRHRPGQPRSERDAAFLERYNTWMQLPIVASAILPLVIVPQSNGWAGSPASPLPPHRRMTLRCRP